METPPIRHKLLTIPYTGGTVVYNMCREIRTSDNEALLFAQKLAHSKNAKLIVNYVIYNYIWTGATRRFYDWVIPSLIEVEQSLRTLNIPLVVTIENKKLFEDHTRAPIPDTIGAVVVEQIPLRFMRRWKQLFMQYHSEIPLYEVDAHNCVPVWEISDKQEFAAHTMRSKMSKRLASWLTVHDALDYHQPNEESLDAIRPVDWSHIKNLIICDETVQGTGRYIPGELAAKKCLSEFIDSKIQNYETDRNDFCVDGTSNLSPYIAHGNISRKTVLTETLKYAKSPLSTLLDKHANGANGTRGSTASFIEELVVRAELAENFCFYNANYDNSAGFPTWAQNTLSVHETDTRQYHYTYSQFADAKTHDALWNAAQLQMVRTGKMHGYLRMYWAKKILEWSPNADVAMRTAVQLNDIYELDGRDPNGYVGCAWSIGGLHDRAWFNRPIFGLVRYMALSGATKHGNVAKFVEEYTKNDTPKLL